MDVIDRLREAARNEATCIELSRQNKELRARLANWQDDINAVLRQRDDLHFRVTRLEEAVNAYFDCVSYAVAHPSTLDKMNAARAEVDRLLRDE